MANTRHVFFVIALPLLLLAGCIHRPAAEFNAIVFSDSAAAANAHLLAAGGEPTHVLPIIDAVGATLSTEVVNSLSGNDGVTRVVVEMGTRAPSVEHTHSSSETRDWLLDSLGRTTQNTWLDSLVSQGQKELTGEGVGLAIIDTGVMRASSDGKWSPNIIARYNAIEDREGSVVDITGHGTHLTSLIAGDARGFDGLAADASLIVVKAFDNEDRANFLNVIRAVQWVVDNKKKHGIQILNLSISASTEIPYHLDPLNQALIEAWNAGLVVVVSAGNEGPVSGSVSAPGNNPWLITVGAASVDEVTGRVSVPPFSGRGPTDSGHIKPDVVAPGALLAGLRPKNAKRPPNEPSHFTSDGLWVTSGASQASVAVSGMVALLLEARPDLSNYDVKCLIANTATPITQPNNEYVPPMLQGRGLIDLDALLVSNKTDCEERLDGVSPRTPLEGAFISR